MSKTQDRQFFMDCARIRRENPAFLEGLRNQLHEYDVLLRTLRGDDLVVMQGRAQELGRILELLETAESVLQHQWGR